MLQYSVEALNSIWNGALCHKNGKQPQTVIECCYRELLLKCDRVPRYDSEHIDKFRLQQ